ncbi:MAG TPA: hypothetical protein VF157_11905 [Chloroflexota bacterium]
MRKMDQGRVARAALAVLVTLLALIAGAIHLVRTLMSLGPPPGPPRSGPPPGGRPPGGGPSGIPALIGPHLAQAFALNFVAFVVLAILFVALSRGPRGVRGLIDVLLILLSAGTLYAWYAYGHINPRGLGMLSLVVELGLIVLAAVHLATLRSHRVFKASSAISPSP